MCMVYGRCFFTVLFLYSSGLAILEARKKQLTSRGEYIAFAYGKTEDEMNPFSSSL